MVVTRSKSSMCSIGNFLECHIQILQPVILFYYCSSFWLVVKVGSFSCLMLFYWSSSTIVDDSARRKAATTAKFLSCFINVETSIRKDFFSVDSNVRQVLLNILLLVTFCHMFYGMKKYKRSLPLRIL